jgi:hypothetical protein
MKGKYNIERLQEGYGIYNRKVCTLEPPLA